MVIVVVIAMALFAVLVKQSISNQKTVKQTPRINQTQSLNNQVKENGEEESINEEENWDDAKVWPEVQFSEADYLGWKTFTNEELRYSIKYPSDWIVNDCDGCLSHETIINPPDAEMFTSYISISIDNRNMEGIREISTNPDYYGGNPYVENKIIFSGQKTYQFLRNTSTMNTRQLFIKKNNLLYDIDTQKDENILVKKVLASFKFTD